MCVFTGLQLSPDIYFKGDKARPFLAALRGNGCATPPLLLKVIHKYIVRPASRRRAAPWQEGEIPTQGTRTCPALRLNFHTLYF